jgi:ribonuclease HI
LPETSTHPSCVQKLTSIPYYPSSTLTPNTRRPKLYIYLVSNERALALLDRTHILTTLLEVITKLLGKPSSLISLSLQEKDPPHINSNTSYTDPYPDIPDSTQYPTKPSIRQFHEAWNPSDFIYTDGSQKSGNPALGASVVNPHTQTTTHIKTNSQPERHTMNIAELAAITIALDLHKELPQIRILTDSSFCINTLRNYVIDPLNFTHHPHKDLLHSSNNLIKTRDEQGLVTLIGKVKSHIGVTYNDEADVGARGVVDGDILPDITFTAVEPLLGGIRT